MGKKTRAGIAPICSPLSCVATVISEIHSCRRNSQFPHVGSANVRKSNPTPEFCPWDVSQAVRNFFMIKYKKLQFRRPSCLPIKNMGHQGPGKTGIDRPSLPAWPAGRGGDDCRGRESGGSGRRVTGALQKNPGPAPGKGHLRRYDRRRSRGLPGRTMRVVIDTNVLVSAGLKDQTPEE